ncbi:MAG TPA: FkbM family methyltransferase [Acidimicrobiia bacterium]
MVAPSSTVVDIGAHKGLYSYELSRLVGPEGRVHAFEPQARLARYLRRAFRDDARVVVHENALSDSSGVRTLSIPDRGKGLVLGHATLEVQHGAHNESVETHCLDELGLSPSYMKIDVEGHELAVLKGSMTTLARAHPVVQIEIVRDGLQSCENCSAILELFDSLGYRACFVDEHATLQGFDGARLLVPDDPIADDRYAYNFVFTRIDQHSTAE